MNRNAGLDSVETDEGSRGIGHVGQVLLVLA